MPTTPIFGFRYPAATDPADVPSDLQKLALDVENLLNARGLMRAAFITGTANITSATGETKLPLTSETDPTGLGTIVSGDWRVDVAGVYFIVPSLYTANLGGGSNQIIYVRLNPAAANTWLCSVNLNAGVALAGGDRWAGGAYVARSLAANDIIRLNGANTEATGRDVGAQCLLLRVG